jgi:hypothetical protein
MPRFIFHGHVPEANNGGHQFHTQPTSMPYIIISDCPNGLVYGED